ncbi:MAG TPA: hypothetical protein GYA08_11095, partial [Chloroflexi bacterium]|nr:hypothetical protein [Chloroflexota bacterium]
MYKHSTAEMQKLITHILMAMILMLVMTLMATTPALAVVSPQPTYGKAVIDGGYAEWNLADDYFASMYRAAKPEKPVESTLYLRYDCATSTGYALVLAQPGVDVLMQPDDAFVKLGNSTKLVDGNAASFAWVQPNPQTGRAQGWEASFSLAPGSYANLNVHTQVYHDGSQTSAVIDRAIPILIECPAMTPTPTPSAPSGAPTPKLTCDLIAVDYHRPLTNGDHINMTIKSGANEFQVNAYVDLNIAGGYNGLGVRFSDGATRPLTQAEVASGVIEWAYPTHASIVALNGAPFQVTFLQANQHDSWPALACGNEPTPTEMPASGSISACKFDDKNANGVQDADEPSISDWQMSIYAGAVEEGEQPIASGVTNADGFINFEKILPGQYTVCEGAVEGWLPTISLCQPVTVLSEQETSVTFGNVRGGRIIVDKVTDPTGADDLFTFN